MVKSANRLVLFLIMLLSQNLFAQNRFSVKIKIPANLQGKRFRIDYDDGTQQINVADSFINNQFQFNGNYVAKYATLILQYVAPDTSFYNEYFIGERPAEFDFSKDSANLNKNFFKNCITSNAIEIDSTEWMKNRNTFSKQASSQMKIFLDKNSKNVWRVDSLTRRLYNYWSILDKKDMECIKRNNNDYTAFWYFRRTIVPGELAINKNNPAAIQKLLAFMNTSFPDKYLKSPEGQNLQESLRARLLTTNNMAPAFEEKDLEGNNINLKEYRGRFLLIDFWASWCIPCRQMTPHLKDLYKKYHSKGLDFISISVDTDSSAWKKAVKAEAISYWVNMLSKDSFDNLKDKIALDERYGVHAYPTIFLLDKKGMIIFRYEGGYDKNGPKSELDKKLEEIFK